MNPNPGGLGGLETLAAEQGPFIVAVTVFLIVWFTIVAITGWLAGRRNREGGLWAAFALFFGPFVLLALLLMPRREKKPSLSPLWEELEQRSDQVVPHDAPAATTHHGTA